MDERLVVKDVDIKVLAGIIRRIPDARRDGKVFANSRFIVAEQDVVGKNGDVEEIGGNQRLGISDDVGRASGRIHRLETGLPVCIIGQARNCHRIYFSVSYIRIGGIFLRHRILMG